METEVTNEREEVKTIEAHHWKFHPEALRANMINATTKPEKIRMPEEPEDADTSLEGQRTNYEDHQTRNQGKEGKFVIKQM